MGTKKGIKAGVYMGTRGHEDKGVIDMDKDEDKVD